MRALLIAAVVLAGLALVPTANAGFFILVPPPQGTSPEKEEDPPPTTRITPTTTSHSPEPGTLIMATLGAGAIATWKRRQRG